MTHPDLACRFGAVGIVASAGGVHAFEEVLGALPADFPAPIAVAMHLPDGFSVLAPILARSTRLRVRWAEQGARLRPETAFVAPSGRHLAFADRHSLRLLDEPRVHGSRPSADVLLSSAAAVFRDLALGVVLTGAGSDGAAGARLIHELGGVVIAQDEGSCFVAGMPRAVAQARAADFVLPLETIAPALISLVAPGTAELFGVARPAVPVA